MNNYVEKACMFFRKAHILLEEAEKDLKIGCYNKAISAFYFAIESLANVLFMIKKQRTRGFGGRLSLIRNFFGIKVSIEIKKLHELREKADHREIIFDKNQALKIAEQARKLFAIIRKRVITELEKLGINVNEL